MLRHQLCIIIIIMIITLYFNKKWLAISPNTKGVEEFVRLCLLTFRSAYRVTGALSRFFEKSPKIRFPSDSPGERWGRAYFFCVLTGRNFETLTSRISGTDRPGKVELGVRVVLDDLYVASSLRVRGTSGSGNIEGRKFSGVRLQIL